MIRVVTLQALSSLLMLAPLAYFGLEVFIGNSDGVFYTTVLRLVAEHMAAGDLRPLWFPEANNGTGSPAMLYYSSFAYQITAILGAPISSIDPLGWKRLVLSMFVAQWLAGIGAYIWLSRMVRPSVALAASLLFTVFPYKLIYIFIHVNLAQLWTLAFLPPLMIAADDITKGKPRAFAWYALWIALLAVTHPRTLFAFAALPAFYALVFSERSFFYTVRQLALAHLLGLALAAYYLMPAFLNTDLVQLQHVNAGRFNYATNFFHLDMRLNFHYLVIVALCIGMFYRLPSLRESRAGDEIWYYVLVTLLITVLCLRISKPVWDAVPMLQMLQFPVARLHATALVAVTALTALFLHYGGKTLRPRALYSPWVMLLPVVFSTAATLNYIHGVYTKDIEGLTMEYIGNMAAATAVTPQEYLTKWQPEDADHLWDDPGLPLAKAPAKAKAKASFRDYRTIEIDATVKTSKALLQIRQLYLPQWRAEGFEPGHDKDGLLTLSLPKGEHHVTLTLAPFKGERGGKLVSLAAFLLLLALLIPRRRPGKWPHPSHA